MHLNIFLAFEKFECLFLFFSRKEKFLWTNLRGDRIRTKKCGHCARSWNSSKSIWFFKYGRFTKCISFPLYFPCSWFKWIRDLFHCLFYVIRSLTLRQQYHLMVVECIVLVCTLQAETCHHPNVILTDTWPSSVNFSGHLLGKVYFYLSIIPCPKQRENMNSRPSFQKSSGAIRHHYLSF